MVIFDCNGVLVDSEPIAVAIAAQEFARAGLAVTPEIITRYFFGRRPADMLAAIEAATKRRLPYNFATKLSQAILERFRAELRPMLHDHLFAADSFAAAHFNTAVVRRLVDEHEQQRVDHSQRLYALLMLELWWRQQRS